MLLKEKISINISYRNKTHYLKLGYFPIIGTELLILIKHLPSSSHQKIDAVCELCGRVVNLTYHKYLLNKENHNFYGCKSCSRQKAAMTSIKKYGVDNYSKTDEFKKRVEKTNIERYGYKTNLMCPDYKNDIKEILNKKYGTENFYEINRKSKRVKNKFKILNIKIDDVLIEYSENLYQDIVINDNYLLYRNECRRMSKKAIIKLYDNWDGLDYYDNLNIYDNLKLDHNDPNYPTIDHKISVYYGFLNNISPEEISDIKNLCITKRSINSKKREMVEDEFKLIF